MSPVFDRVLGRRILSLSGPVVGAMVTQTAINIVDHIMVGRLPEAESTPGQAAVQFGVTLLWAVGGVLSAISVGTQALTARRVGGGDVEGAGKVLANSVAISTVLGLICSVVFYFLAPYIFPFISKDIRVLALGVPFLQYRYVQVLSMAVTASFKSFFDGIGQTKVHFYVAVTMNLLNLVLNYGLIYGHLGLPRMGVPGSGLASCISSYVGMAMIIGWSLLPAYRRFHVFHLSKLDGAVAKEIGRLSGPSGAAVIASLFGFLVFFKVVAKLDADAALLVPGTLPIYSAATANLVNILQLVFISGIAYGSATATLVGQSMGAEDYSLAERYAFQAARIGAAFYAFFGLLTVAFPTVILHGWCKDIQVIEVAAPVLRVLGFFEPFMCVALVFLHALYGAGNSRFVMIVELTLHFSCLIPLSYVLAIPLGFGMWGAWGAMIAYVVLMAIIMAWKFSTGTWKQIRI